LICVAIAGGFLYSYIGKQNDLTAVRIAIPLVLKEVKNIQEENTRLSFEIEQFQSPSHLMELVRMPQFAYLKNSLENQVISLPLPPPLPNDEDSQ
jgi:hypothetical protein